MHLHFSAPIYQAIVGVFFLTGLAWLFSENKKHINWRLITVAFLVQNCLFLLICYVPPVHHVIEAFAQALVGLLTFANTGAKFIFGNFADTKQYGFVFFMVVIPTLIFFGALIGILYFFGIIQFVIKLLAAMLRKVVKLSGAESLIVIADIFLGQSEGPLIIGPYIKNMTRSELACAFTAGLANISGSTLGMYLMFLTNGHPEDSFKFASYLVTAIFMNALSAIFFAKILFPETDFANVATNKTNDEQTHATNLLDSIFNGAMTGLKIGAAIVAMLIAVIALIHLIDYILAYFGNFFSINTFINTTTHGTFSSLSLEYVLGQLFRIFAFFMGIHWAETISVGSLLGQKVAINEFVAYMSLGQMKLQHLLSPEAIFISTFALASFSNFSSIGCSLGTFAVLAPERLKELGTIAWKALFGAVLAGFMTATVAGFWHNLFN